MSTFLEIMGTLELRDSAQTWEVLCRLERELFTEYGRSGLRAEVSASGNIVAVFDFAGECGGTSGTAIENDLKLLNPQVVRATYLIVGWDNIRERQFYGAAPEVASLRSRLAVQEISTLGRELLPEDALEAIRAILTIT